MENLLFLSIQVKLVTEGFQTLDTCYADLVEILDEGQGIQRRQFKL